MNTEFFEFVFGVCIFDDDIKLHYANPAKFAAAVRRWVGCTPVEWKLGNLHSIRQTKLTLN